MLNSKITSKKNGSGRKVRSSFTVTGRTKEIITGKDMTKPNMTKSIREMLVRHANGIVDNVDKTLSYSGDLPDLRNIDLHEINRGIEIAKQNAKDAEAKAEDLAIQIHQERYKQRVARDKARYDEYMKNKDQ